MMRDGRLHVVLGIKETQIVDEFKKALMQADYKEPIVICKTLKLSIQSYIENNRDVDVLILQEGLEASRLYQVSEYAKYLDMIDNLKIIPILTDESSRNKQLLLELYNHHLMTAVFGSGTISDIVQLIRNGRTRVAARQYYNLSIADVGGEEDIDYDSLVEFILHGDGSLKDRLDYIRVRLQPNEFKVLLKRLPLDCVKMIAEIPEYALLIQECFPDGFDAVSSHESSGDGNTKGKRLLGETLGETLSGVDGLLSQSVNKIGDMVVSSSPVLVDYLSAIKKVVFGFAGTQEHIGATFNAIAFAQYLSSKDYKVAVIEDGSQKNLSLHALEKNGGAVKTSFGFTYKGVDYYPEFPLAELPRKLLVADYNFVLIDFGMFRKEILPEFSRCVLPIIVAGSRIWEYPYVEQQVFSMMDDPEALASCCYLFLFAGPAARRSITKNMAPLKKVFFADYLENPLAGTGYLAMEKMIGSYLPADVSVKEKGETVFTKVRKLFD